jgi:HK97 family phage portal protein
MPIKQWMQKQVTKLALKMLAPVDSSRGWIPILQEGYLGAFQADDPVTLSDALAHPTVYACITQIAGDLGKMRLRLMEADSGIWNETISNAYSPVLRKPNHFQTRQKFVENWIISKLTHGNTYVLKVRDERKVVIALYVLDPARTEPLIADNGSVFYRTRKDLLSHAMEDLTVPASEIIHDTMECLYHPLVGVPPLYAASLATTQGLAMQRNSARFFQNNSQPGGILTAPGHIKDDTAQRIKTNWTENYSGNNAGKLAVLGDGLKYEPLAVTAKDSTLVEQMKWSDEKICSVYKVPPYKVHVGPAPTYQQSETLDRKYYSDCLQRLIEAIESLLDDGLSLPSKYGTEFDIDDLMRMDVSLKMDTAVKAVGGGIYSPNEGRRKFNLNPVKGGNTPYLQQQNYSLAALDERDRNNPFEKPAAPTTSPAEPIEEPEPDPDETDKALHLLFRKSITKELEHA